MRSIEKYIRGYYLSEVEIKYYNVMSDRKSVFVKKKLKVIWQHIITFKKLQQVKEMITQLVVCCIITISVNTVKW